MSETRETVTLLPALRRGVLGLKEVYGQAMGVAAPLGSVVSTTTAAIMYAGAAVPFATLLAFLGSMLWIWILAGYSRRLASPGGFYSFSSAAFGSSKLSLFEALAEVASFIFLNAFDAVAVYLLVQVAATFFGLQVSPVYAALAAALTVLYPTLASLTDVRSLMGRVVTVGSTLEVVVLVAFFAYVVAKHGFTPVPFEPGAAAAGAGGLATAFILSIVSLDGAGTATYLGEETKTPTKTITKGMWLANTVGGIAMILGSYAIVVGWGLSNISTLPESPQPLFQEMGGISLVALAVTAVLGVNSILVQNIGSTVSAARILFNLARENSAPKAFGRVLENGQPLVATIFVGLVSGILAAGSIAWLGVEGAFTVLGIPLSVLWVLGRTIDTLGLPLFLKRIGGFSISVAAACALMTALHVWGIFMSFSPPSTAAALLLGCFGASYLAWYLVWGTKGMAGRLAVDDDCSIVSIDERIRRLRSSKP